MSVTTKDVAKAVFRPWKLFAILIGVHTLLVVILMVVGAIVAAVRQ